MDNVQFSNEWRPPRFEPETPKMIRGVMKYSGGLIKNEKQANFVLLSFVILATTVAFFLFFTIPGGDQEILPPPPNSDTNAGQ